VRVKLFRVESHRVNVQGGLDTSEKMSVSLQAFCDHINETGWSQWTYVQDELFLPMRQFLRQDVGTSVREMCLLPHDVTA